MTIKEAQEYSREHGLTNISVNELRLDNTIERIFTEDAWESLCVIEAALDNGYQLCKVDEMIENIKDKSTMMADCNYPLGDSMEYGLYVKDIEEIIEEACRE